MESNIKTLGAVMIGFSLILLFVLTFIKINTDNSNALLCDTFTKNNWDMTQCPAHKSNTSWMILLAFGIGFLILGSGLYMLFFHKSIAHEAKKEFKLIDLSKMSEEEKNIYSIIKGNSGSVYQSDIIKGTGFSKVKTTRILDKLESGDIIERKRRGMTNIIVLK
ncbi:MAG TPA: hypothetical protein VJJ52_04640 [Candidatus Nanoarchaeia archaeon]|nr:hypothetical protein [Candidatus Nanoarchaeia archaeon]